MSTPIPIPRWPEHADPDADWDIDSLYLAKIAALVSDCDAKIGIGRVQEVLLAATIVALIQRVDEVGPNRTWTESAAKETPDGV